MSTIFVSTDQSLIDFTWLIPALQSEPWGAVASAEDIRLRASKSLCFGVYERIDALGVYAGDTFTETIPSSIRQLGFARVLTDGVSVSFLSDVLIDKLRRGEGLGTRLMECVLGHKDVKACHVLLGTKTAWLFYERLGFTAVDQPMMIRAPMA